MVLGSDGVGIARSVVDLDDVDMLENEPEGSSRLAGRWSRRPRWWRWVGVLLGIGAMLPVLVTSAQDWAAERAAQDELLLSARLRVWTSSTNPVGGRVDYFVVIRNAGERPVVVTGVDVAELRLRVTDRVDRGVEVAAGDVRSVPVSVRLSCAPGADFDRDAALRAVVSAEPQSGRQRAVTVPVERSELLTDVANTLCSVRPDLADKELSGPILGS